MKPIPISRRNALQLAAAAGAGGFAIQPSSAIGEVTLKKNAVVLFQGDSITDAGRDKNRKGPNDPAAFGRGYPFMIASALLAKYPALELKIFNRGISGNKVPDLDKRWQEDCLDLKPDVLSILIGVNDLWHKLNGRYDGTAEVYRDGFIALLEKTRQALPEVKLVICEPFVLRCGAVNDSWFPDFDQRKAFAKAVAEKAGATWIPLQDMFTAAVADGVPPSYWAGDGVHPTHAGHGLMTNTWLAKMGW